MYKIFLNIKERNSNNNALLYYLSFYNDLYNHTAHISSIFFLFEHSLLEKLERKMIIIFFI